MPYCRNCGSEVRMNDIKCFECGERLENKQNRKLACPSCESNRLTYVTSSSGSDFNAESACCGYILFGPLGLLCGLSNEGKQTTTRRKCVDCGHEF